MFKFIFFNCTLVFLFFFHVNLFLEIIIFFGFKLDFPVATFETFLLFQWKRLKTWKSIKSGVRKIQFKQVLILLRSFQGVFSIKAIQGYPNLDSYFAFNYLVCVWECITVGHTKLNFAKYPNSILPSIQVQGLLWTILTSAISFFQGIWQIQHV